MQQWKFINVGEDRNALEHPIEAIRTQGMKEIVSARVG
jgi:hypothetical protein